MALTADIKLIIRTLLNDEWTAANTYGVMPIIHTGWYNQQWSSPQVSMGNSSYSVLGGGQTGFSANTPDGSGPMKMMTADVPVVVWVPESFRTEYEGDPVNPKDLAPAMAVEVRRIVRENLFSLVASGVDWISAMSGRSMPDVLSKPIQYREEVVIRSKYEERP